MKDDTILSSSRLNPCLSWIGGHVSNIRAYAHTRSHTHTCTHLQRSHSLNPVIAFVVSTEGRGDGTETETCTARTADERGKKREGVERRLGESRNKPRERRIDKLIDKWKEKEKE